MLTGILLLDGPKMMLPGTPTTSADWLAAMQKAFLHTAGLITRTSQSHPIAALSSPSRDQLGAYLNRFKEDNWMLQMAEGSSLNS
jgi:hypothetical protein